MAGPAPEGKTSAELNAGNGLVGTGPFKFVEWQRGSRIVGERNDAYWGGKPDWQKVILRPLSNNTARVAALLSGDVDLIEDPPTTDLAKLKNDPKITPRPRGLQPRHLHPSRPARRAADRHSRHQRQEPADRQAGARGAVDRHRPQGHRRQDHGRRRPAGRRPAALPDGRHEQGHADRQVRSGRRQEAAGRGGLSQRLLDHAGRAQRPLHQRPQDRPGGRLDVEPHRRQDRSRRRRAAGVLQEPRQLQVLRLSWRAGAPSPASSATP